MIAIKRLRQYCMALMFGLGLLFSIGLVNLIRAEEAIVFREKAGPDAFGSAVDISGDTLIVGAPAKENGEVYIFARQGNAWVQQARIKTPRPNPGGWFGGAVCIDGDTAVVGARTVFNGTHGFTFGSGVVYIYQREGKNFMLKQKLSPEDAQDGERFGFAVDLSGDTLVVGSPFHGDGDGSDLGVVYAYVREEEEFQFQRIFFGEGGRDRFGWSVANSGNRVIIGSPHIGRQTPGAAYIFKHNEAEWTQELRLNASNKKLGANFGFAVDIGINRAVVGAPLEDSVGKDAGAVYSFLREGDTWVEKARFTSKGVIQGEPHKIWNGDVYGNAVAVARKGPYAIVGAPGDNLHRVPPNPSGAVYVYDTEEDFLTPRPVESISLKATTLGDVKRTALLQNFPNPFNPETWIPYQLVRDADVNISIYDVQGHRVRRIELGVRAAGVYLDKDTAAYWDGRSDRGESVSSGVYYYHLRADDFQATRRMVIVK